MKAFVLVAAAALGLAAPPVDAKCMQLELRPFVLTTKVEITPAGGGIVVGTEGAGVGDKTERATDQPTWKINTGPTKEAPVITTLAPGLVLYGLPAASKGRGELVTGKGKILGLLKTTKKAFAVLDAPVVKAIKHSSGDITSRRNSEDTMVELDGNVPATAIAMILYDSKGTALSWRRANPGVPAVRVYYNGHCDVSNGTLPPTVGDKVTLAWVDKHGRLSPKSKAIAVVKGAD